MRFRGHRGRLPPPRSPPPSTKFENPAYPEKTTLSFDLGKRKEEGHLVLEVGGQFVGLSRVEPDHHRGATLLPIFSSLSSVLFPSVDRRVFSSACSPVLADLASVHLVVGCHTLFLQCFGFCRRR